MIERSIRNAVKSKYDARYRTLILAIETTYDYWKQNDYMEHGELAHVFEYLYLKPENFNNSQVKISLDLGISDRTLLRYRKKFVALVEYNYRRLQCSESDNSRKICN